MTWSIPRKPGDTISTTSTTSAVGTRAGRCSNTRSGTTTMSGSRTLGGNDATRRHLDLGNLEPSRQVVFEEAGKPSRNALMPGVRTRRHDECPLTEFDGTRIVADYAQWRPHPSLADPTDNRCAPRTDVRQSKRLHWVALSPSCLSAHRRMDASGSLPASICTRSSSPPSSSLSRAALRGALCPHANAAFMTVRA